MWLRRKTAVASTPSPALFPSFCEKNCLLEAERPGLQAATS